MANWEDRFEAVLDGLVELSRRVRNSLNWRLVRGVGQLQILTRASFVLLVLVPLMASLWPLVRVIVNQNNHAINEATRLLKIADSDLDRAIEKAREKIDDMAAKRETGTPRAMPGAMLPLLSELTSHTQSIRALSERYATDFADRVIDTPRLPWSLGAAFFSALFVVLGHLVYQLTAPEEVRTFTWEGFVSARKEDYAKHPNDDALARAHDFVDTRLGRRLAESDRYAAEDILRRLFDKPQEERERELRDLSNQRLRELIDWLERGKSPAPEEYRKEMLGLARRVAGMATRAIEDADKIRDMTIIDRGARAEYLHLAGKNVVGIALSGVLYGIAIWLILLIILVQATSVINAAGWHRASDLLWH